MTIISATEPIDALTATAIVRSLIVGCFAGAAVELDVRRPKLDVGPKLDV